MGLFSKKTCNVCGEPGGRLFGNLKLADGIACKKCKAKFSPYWEADSDTTVAQVKEHLAYREDNQRALAGFSPTDEIGGERTFLVDRSAGTFVFATREELRDGNPDLFRLSQVEGVEVRVVEYEEESTDSDGNTTHDYYEYNFFLNAELDHPFARFASFRVNDRAVRNRSSSIKREKAEAVLAGREELKTGLFSGVDKRAWDRYLEQLRIAKQAAEEFEAVVREANATQGGGAVAQGVGATEVAPGAARFCGNCGTPLTAGARFCPECGAQA